MRADWSGGANWVEYSAKGALPLIRTSFTGSVAAYSPTHAAWVGGEYNDTQYLQQVVTVPSGQPYLAYGHWIASADFCGYDFARIRVNGTQVAAYDLGASANTNDCAGVINSAQFSLIETKGACSIVCGGDGNKCNVAALTEPLGDNGGATPTHMLQAGSPVIDARAPSGCDLPGGGALAIDQRGYIRPSGARGRWR